MALHNRVNGKVLKEKLREDRIPRTTLSFYRYVIIADPGSFRNKIYEAWSALGVLGRAYVAHEGINAQLSVPTDNLTVFKDALQSEPALKDLRLNQAIEDNGKSFFKLKVLDFYQGKPIEY